MIFLLLIPVLYNFQRCSVRNHVLHRTSSELFLIFLVCEPAGVLTSKYEVVSKGDAGCVATMTTNPIIMIPTTNGPYGTSYHEADVTCLVNDKQKPIQPPCRNVTYGNSPSPLEEKKLMFDFFS